MQHGWVVLSVLAASIWTGCSAEAQERPATPFNRTILVARAADLAKQPFVEPTQPKGAALPKLSYDQYRSIRFHSGAQIWARENRNFTVELFFPGFIYATPVNVNLVVAGIARRVLFTNEVFDLGPNVPQIEAQEDLAYSGFRVRAPINRPDYLDEFLVFQGATYFRAVPRGLNYGLSARGLAIRTARPEGEEFPVFTDFWLERPPEHAEEIVIHALLQSPSVVGAYTFKARPGAETVVDVQATLFPRREIRNFGIAPLTSMFLFDATSRGRFDDFRDAVHDSDGLEMLTGTGERIWRPLANPRVLQVSGFMDSSPRGFGLLQRKRHVEDFEDYEAHYERRPSAWVEPQGEWGPGHVELVEIPSDREIHDNIVAYWQSDAPLPAGQATEFSYRLRWTVEPLDLSLARVAGTRAGKALDSDQRAFVVDFQSGAPIPDDVQIQLTSSAGTIHDPRGQKVTPELFRVNFELAPERAELVELRMVLTSKDKPWSETWLYRWSR
jgi:glucans biosynthesis protein